MVHTFSGWFQDSCQIALELLGYESIVNDKEIQVTLIIPASNTPEIMVVDQDTLDTST